MKLNFFKREPKPCHMCEGSGRWDDIPCFCQDARGSARKERKQ